jgi:uncharacterized membrane protein (UPF0182 family)
MMALPPLTQTFRVQPNELELETPYLRHNIQFTRTAFQLDRIKDVTYPALADLTPEAVARNEDTIQNVRLWDWRLLLQTYRQTQEIRLYYQFYDVDVDRYHLPDGYHQVMLSARELSEELPEKARTWFNQYLQFTHGYGIVMSFVSKIIGGGFPQYLLQNIPPESAYDLTVDRPAIYYGERMPGYRIVSTGVKEFDYPKGDQNVYTSYQGKGGVQQGKALLDPGCLYQLRSLSLFDPLAERHPSVQPELHAKLRKGGGRHVRRHGRFLHHGPQ